MAGVTDLELGRKLYLEQAWVSAFDSLASADRKEPLGAEDLEMLARSAYMLGRDDDYVGGLERAHQAYLDEATCRARGALRLLDRPQLSVPRRASPRHRVVRPRTEVAREFRR